MMKRISIIITAVFLLIQSATTSFSQSGYDLYQRALVKERGEGNLREAIAIYQRVVSEHGGNRQLAARAQLRIGVLYDRLGRKADAQRAYQSVVSQFADQATEARQAQAKIISTSNSKPAGKENPTNGKAATTVITRLVWSGGWVDDQGSPSPDGRHLSFTDWSTGDLAIRDLVTNKNRRLTNKDSWNTSNEYAEFSRMSSDGQQIAYSWFNGKFYELRVIGLDGSNLRILYSNPESSYVRPFSWSADGKYLVAGISRMDHTNQIALLAVAEAKVRILKSVDWRHPLTLSISPDGGWIAYDFPPTEESSQRDIFLLATDGSRESRIVEHPAHDFLLGWSPDGERLVFASDRTGVISVWAIQISAGKPEGEAEMIRRDVGQIIPMGFTRDGAFFYGTGGIRDVYVGDIDPASFTILTSKNAASRYVGTNYLPAWSPDGERLAFLSRRGPPQSGFASRVLVIQSVKTGEERVLTPKLRLPINPNPRHSPAWSPDGRFIAVFGYDEKGRSGLHRINVQTGEVRPLIYADARESVDCPNYSSDGQTFLFRRRNSNDGETSLVARHIETSNEKKVYSARHIGNIAQSPDNRQLAFCATHPSGEGPEALLVMPASGGQARVLFQVPKGEGINAIAWTSDGRWLLYITNSEPDPGKPGTVWRVSVEGGKPEPTRLVLMPIQLGGLSFHPDGKRVALPDLSKAGTEIYAIENFLPRRNPAR
ncbi:MAG TPA: tetratricopeptide repeat protein [Blastocatellia bacterium]|nr:tetratricopeptide repeat protein [Blastocatellia bacterium]